MFYKIFLIILIIIIVILIFFFGNTVESNTNLDFNYDVLYFKNKQVDINLVEDYINFQEDNTPYLNHKQRKEIIWFEKKIKTDSVVYFIHGFNGSKNEGKDMCLMIAKYLKANLLLSRFPGCGVFNKESSFKNITFYDHIRTVYEDLVLCSLLGNKIYLVGTSTGCTYSIIASTIFTNFNIDKTIFFSPNMGLHLFPSIMYNLLSSGFGKTIIGLASDKFKINNYIISPEIFMSLIGSLDAFQRIKHKFDKDFIIFISEHDEWVSTHKVNLFFNNNKSKIKQYFIIKNKTTHRILKIGKNSLYMDKIINFLNIKTNNIENIESMYI